MADYHSPTVVTPNIPEDAMTPLERLILGLVFDEELSGDGEVYFHSWCGPSEIVTLSVDDLHVALEKSREQGETGIGRHIEELLARYDAQVDEDAPDDIDVDLTGIDAGWDRIFQDILRRLPQIDEIIVMAAWTCTRMRSDGFGGSIVRVTENAIEHSSTDAMLETMRNAEVSPGDAAGGHESRGRLEAIADTAGWDSFTLLLLIARWLDQIRKTDQLVDYLNRLASEEDD